MNNPTAWQRFRYWFDNLMSKGTKSLLLILAVITAVVVVIGGLISIALGGADGSGADSAGHSIWFTLMHAINTGVLAKEEGTVPYLFVMTIVTLVGIFITSFLIGTISNGIKEKVSDLQRGHSKVIERDHVVIIGFDENVTSIIRELALASENQVRETVVILADKDKTKMEQVIRDSVPELGSLRVICRSGDPDNINDLKICSLQTCKSIIVNLSDDFMTLKAVLACESLLDEAHNSRAYITAVLRDRETLQAAKIAGGERAELLNFQKTIARLMTQTSRHPGMSEVLAELLSFKGNEVYVRNLDSCAGHTLEELNLMLHDTTVIGFVRDSQPVLNPAPDTLVEKGDQIICIDDDDNVLALKQATPYDEAAIQQGDIAAEEPHRLLILGYSDLYKQLIAEEDSFAPAGSTVTIAASPDTVSDDMLPAPETLKNIEVVVRECNIYSRSVLEELVSERPTGILLLADQALSDEEADARTLMLQLQLNDISEKFGADVPLTIEMNSTRNQTLSQMMRATDFVVSSRITAKMMVQVSEDRHKKEILNDLISDGGSAVYMKPADAYVSFGMSAGWGTYIVAAARRSEIAIGYKNCHADGTFDICLNPDNDTVPPLGPGDDLIVVACS